MEYNHWAEYYDESVRDLSESIWKPGVIAELKRHGIAKGNIMDAGAGTGIGCRLLRESGDYEITAVDRNEAMLRHLGTLADHVIHSDLREIPELAGKFHAIVSGFDTINYLTAEGLQKFILWGARHLKPDGKMIFDYSTPCYLQETWRDLSYDQTLQDGHVLSWSHRWDNAVRCSRTVLTLRHEDVELWNEEHIQYSYDTYRLHQIAMSAGMKIQLIRDLDSDSFSPSAETQVIVLVPLEVS